MLEIEIIQQPRLLILRPNGPLESADFERLRNQIGPILQSHGMLDGILISARSFPGWKSLGAVLSHLKFVINHHRQIARIAAVTDSNLIRVLAHFAGLFVHPEIKIFVGGSDDQALTWLQTNESLLQKISR